MIGASMARLEAPAPDRERGVRRVVTVWHLFRAERHDPAPFYRWLAAELVDDLERQHGQLAGQRVLDLGCGPGWYAEALRARGVVVVPLDGSLAELDGGDGTPTGVVVGDAGRMPLPDACTDGVVCSNMLEHTPDAPAVLADIGRVLRPGGWAYVSWTNWYSPWGGHDMTPWHFLGPRIGPRVYERLFGPPRKNRAGEALFPVHIGRTLALVRESTALELVGVEPRYWPWARVVTKVPGLREVATWNCVLHLRRRPPGPDETWRLVADVDGWMSGDQAVRLWRCAGEVPAGGSIVEIGSYHGRSTIVIARAAPDGATLVSIDPHAGNDRGPQQWHGTAEEGEADHRRFLANLERAGVRSRVRHLRRFSHDALDEVGGDVDLLYIDGAHGFVPSRDDIVRWGAKVRPGGTVLIHDAFSSVGVTLALLITTFAGGRYRYAGRSRSMVEYRVDDLRPVERLRNLLVQAAQLPWFVRNVAIKLLMVTGLGGLVRLLGHHDRTWPY
jgi:SAM-dependent methyltransferase/predicted O-methyltransferase YrrM